MTVSKRIVCLANSRKLGGRCVAGKEFTGDLPGPWIRPVSAREHGELYLPDRQYDDGKDPSILDIMDVPLAEAQPKSYQQENWMLASQQPWRRIGSATWSELHRFIDAVVPLWGNYQSTAKGLNDEVPLRLAAGLTSSLQLISVQDVVLSVIADRGRKRVQGKFRHAGTDYWLWVTDPRYEEPYKRKPDGNYSIGDCALTISLSEPFAEQNACYKLIAAIIQRSEAQP